MSRFADIGAAVIGTGFIGTVHVEQLRRIGVDVRGVLGSTPERAAARASALSIGHAYAGLDEILADPAVHVVHVTSPNHLHVPQSAAILAAGKHVVCEKPLAMTAAQSASLVDQAQASGLVNAVNFNIRFYPLHQHMREAIAGGEIGDVRFVTGHYFQDWLLHDTDWNWRLEPDKGGALRAIGDIGSHWLDLTSFLTGQPIVSVMADLSTFITTRREPTASSTVPMSCAVASALGLNPTRSERPTPRRSNRIRRPISASEERNARHPTSSQTRSTWDTKPASTRMSMRPLP